MPSLERESARRWATLWATQRQAARRAAKDNMIRRPPAGPPNDEHVWLDTTTAAIIVGFTAPWMRHLAETQRAPATTVAARWWWRRDLIESYAAARAAGQDGALRRDLSSDGGA